MFKPKTLITKIDNKELITSIRPLYHPFTYFKEKALLPIIIIIIII